MPLELMTTPVLSTCYAQLARIIEEMEAAPSRTAFFDLGAAAEIVVLAPAGSDAESLRRLLAEAGARWLRSGLLEELVVTRVEFAYHVALLSYLARGSQAWSPSDMETIRTLAEGRLIVRSEIPVMRQLLINAYLSRSGVPVDVTASYRTNFAKVIDKRVLRARPYDEFDLHTLVMCAQLIQLQSHGGQLMPRVQPLAMLIETVRERNRNWAPVLAFLCTQFFGLPEMLRSGVAGALREIAPADGELLPPPPTGQTDSEHVERSERGLRLRSTIALALCSPE
ncbi:MAG TPA: hypothetical protein VE974_00670 [Thermoanaerobaculia bacterium]|nr:hypothetical protein [Thermoanaerobaculia bacterium]